MSYYNDNAQALYLKAVGGTNPQGSAVFQAFGTLFIKESGYINQPYIIKPGFIKNLHGAIKKYTTNGKTFNRCMALLLLELDNMDPTFLPDASTCTVIDINDKSYLLQYVNDELYKLIDLAAHFKSKQTRLKLEY